MVKIAINGFGRIGRVISRINSIQKKFELVLINDIIPSVDNMAYLLKYDSNYGNFPGEVTVSDGNMNINGKVCKVTQFQNILDIPWDKYKVDVVIDASGVEKNVTSARQLVQKGLIKNFVYTMSSPNVDREVIMGVNDSEISSSQNVLSSSICDANAIAHILEFIHKEYTILSGSVTTLHPWLTYQNLMDGAAKGVAPDPNKYTPLDSTQNFGLGRASVDAIIPKTTTAMKCTEKVLSELDGRILSHSYRVPTAIVSCSDIVLTTEKKLTQAELVSKIENWAKTNKYVSLNYEARVSNDYKGETASVVIDMQWLQVKNGLVKIVAWYDNEWGYSARVLDLVEKIGSNGK